MAEVFNKYARIYDAFYTEKDYKSESDYVLSILNATEISSALELGCGTGRYTNEFALRGMNVHGIDFSYEMIQIAQDNYASLEGAIDPKSIFEVADIRFFSSEAKFDLVLSLFHVVNYMIADEDLERFFRTAHRALVDGGSLVFDYWYGPAVISNPPEVRTRSISLRGSRIKRTAIPVLDTKKNCVDVNYKFEVDQFDMPEKETFEETHKMRYLFENEIATHSSGLFKYTKSYGWMTKETPSDSNWSAVAVLKKI